jgi:hypothetical protein
MSNESNATHCEIFEDMVKAFKTGNACLDYNNKPLFYEFVCWTGHNKHSYQCDWLSDTSLWWFVNSRGKVAVELQEIPFTLKALGHSIGFGDNKDEKYHSSTWVFPQKPSVNGKIQYKCYIGPPVQLTRLKSIPDEIIHCDLNVPEISTLPDMYSMNISIRGT